MPQQGFQIALFPQSRKAVGQPMLCQLRIQLGPFALKVLLKTCQ